MTKPRQLEKFLLPGILLLWSSLGAGGESSSPSFKVFLVHLKGDRTLTCRSVDASSSQLQCEISTGQIVMIPRDSVLRVTEQSLPSPSALQQDDPAVQETPSSSSKEILLQFRHTDDELKGLNPDSRRIVQHWVTEYVNGLQENPIPNSRMQDLALRISREYLRVRNWYYASQWLDRAEKHGGDNSRVLYQRAWMAYQQRRFTLARSMAQQAQRQAPHDPTVLELLGEIAEAEDRLEDAYHHYEQALTLRQNPDLRTRLAKLKVQIARMSHYRDRVTRIFNIRYSDQISQRLERDLVALLTNLYQEVRRKTQWDVLEPIPVRVYTQTDYRTLLDTPDWSSAAYDGILHIPIHGLEGSTLEFRRSLRHELCHALVTQHSAALAPPWFQEGIAQTCEFTDSPNIPEQEFQKICRNKGKPPVGILQAASFNGFSGSTAVALYRTAYAFVQYLVERYSTSGVQRFINAMGDGHPWLQAFELAFGRPFPIVYESWNPSIHGS